MNFKHIIPLTPGNYSQVLSYLFILTIRIPTFTAPFIKINDQVQFGLSIYFFLGPSIGACQHKRRFILREKWPSSRIHPSFTVFQIMALCLFNFVNLTPTGVIQQKPQLRKFFHRIDQQGQLGWKSQTQMEVYTAPFSISISPVTSFNHGGVFQVSLLLFCAFLELFHRLQSPQKHTVQSSGN